MRISEAAEHRVLEAARELGYRPSLLARGLRTQLTQTIGLISDVVASEPYAGELIRGAMASALEQDQLLFVVETGGDPALEERLVRAMLDRGVDGFLYAALQTRSADVSPVLRSRPVVLMNCVSDAGDLPAVIPDEHAAGRTAARALLDSGHRDSIYLLGETPAEVMAGMDRLAGITAEFSAAGLAPPVQIQSSWWPDSAYVALRDLLAAGTRPRAVICLNDRVALGAYQALAEVGLRIPADVSVVSFDDSDLAGWLRPQLTSVAIPHLEIGRRAVELLLAPSDPPGVVRVPMPLRERESIGGA